MAISTLSVALLQCVLILLRNKTDLLWVLHDDTEHARIFIRLGA